MEIETPAEQPSTTASVGRGALLLSAALLVVATVLRVAGGWNDLWLDEIWSLDVAREVRSPLDVFTRLHHEINHYGNTLWLWLVGSRGNWLGYRVPSLIAGIGSVALAGVIARRCGAAAMVCTMAVTSLSYVLVLYSSEVRGYAALVFFSFLCFLLLESHLRRDDWRVGAAFSLGAVFGLVSHLLFVSVLLAAIAAVVFALVTRGLSLGAVLQRLALCFALPLLCLAVLYWIDVREIVEGGGGVVTGSLIADYGTALAWALGAPLSPTAQLVACVLAVGLFDVGVRRIARTNRAITVFFAGSILVFPVALAVLRDSPVLYPRHFIVSIAFLTLLFGIQLAALWERGRAWRGVAALLFLAFAVANGAHVIDLIAHGRGETAAALRFILERSDPGVVTIGADDDFRIQLPVDFHRREVEGGERIEFQPRDAWQGAGPQWLIVNREPYARPGPHAEQIRDPEGRRFDYLQSFPSAPLAGLHWFVYRNAAR